ncbi:MAG: hypothetical protein ACJ8FS_10730 [Sphingomicrobium sp.]
MNRFTSTSALPLCLLLAACGGGGDGTFIASTPPSTPTPTLTPTPTPTPTLPSGTVTYVYPTTTPVDIKTSWLDSPATRAGTYDLIGRLTLTPGNGDPTFYRDVVPGQFNMTVAGPTDRGLSYTLNPPAGILPAGLTTSKVGSPQISWDINSTVAYRYTNTYGDTSQYLGERLAGFANGIQLFSYDYTRGSWSFGQTIDAATYVRTALDYDIAYSYVAMGEWSWDVVDSVNGNLVPGTSYGMLLFVNGDRTPAAGIPVSGTATYDARTLLGWVKSPFTLTADFGQRTIAALIDQDYRYNPNGDSMDYPLAFGIHVAGNAPFSNDGSFEIPLTGTANFSSSYAINTPLPPPSEPIAGAMNGAFFGPHAEQIGGTLSLNRSNGVLLLQDAFVGQQHH